MSPYKLLTGRGLALKLSKVLELNCYFAYGTSGTFNYIYNSFFVDKKKRQHGMFNFTFIYIQVWDSTILQTEVDNFYDSDMNEFIDALQQNITVLYAILF